MIQLRKIGAGFEERYSEMLHPLVERAKVLMDHARKVPWSSGEFSSEASEATKKFRVQVTSEMRSNKKLGGGLKYFLFSSLFGEMIQFD